MKKASNAIAKEVAVRGQRVIYREVLKINDISVRVDIESDAYAEQCRASVDRWDGVKWQHVHSLLGLKTPKCLYVHPDKINEASFQVDRDRLIAIYKEIVG